MVLPKPFTTTSRSISVFNYEDIANGTGTAVYYLAQEKDSSDTGQFLTGDSAITSDPTQTSDTATSGGNVDVTYNYDVMFNSPRTINGDIICNIDWNLTETGSQSGGTFYISVEANHYDGSTETVIGTLTTSETITPPNDTFTTGIFCLKIPNTTKVYFAKGTYLRLSLRVVATRVTGQTVTAVIKTNPADSDSKLFVPFEVVE